MLHQTKLIVCAICKEAGGRVVAGMASYGKRLPMGNYVLRTVLSGLSVADEHVVSVHRSPREGRVVRR
eukprot:12893797-Prorocentrum_lima.AAC.1